MTVVYMDEMKYLYEGTRLYVGSLEIDIDRMLTESPYMDQMLPGLSSVARYTLKIMPFVDAGVYFIQSRPNRATNLLSGVYTETEEFDTLFSFRGLLRQILIF